MGFHYDPYVLVFPIFGWFVGLISGYAVMHYRLGILSKNGEHRIRRKTLAGLLIIAIAWVVVCVIAILPIIISMSVYATLLLGDETWSFLSSLFAAIYAAQTILFGHWERKHGRIILSDSLSSTRIYAFPETDKVRETDGH